MAPLAVVGIVHQALAAGARGLGMGVIGLVLGIALLFLPFMRGWIGGGDVKLLGAIGAWLGPRMLVDAVVVSAAFAGILVIALLVRDRRLRHAVATNLTATLLTREAVSVEARPRAQAVPLGAAMAAAGLWSAYHLGWIHG